MKTFQALLLLIFYMALASITSPASTLTERPISSDCTNAVGIGTWCGKAIEERGIVVGDTNAFLPKVSSQQEIVSKVRLNIRTRYPSYIKPGISDVAGVLNTYGVSGLQWSNDVAFLTFCGLPSDWFSSSVNLTLQSPASSNGWYMAKGCLTNMLLTVGNAVYSGNSLWGGYSDFERGNEDYYGPWVDVVGSAESHWINWDEDDGFGYPAILSSGNSYGEDWDYAAMASEFWHLGYNNAVGSISRLAEVYHKAGAPQFMDGYNNSYYVYDTVFDAQNTSVANGWWKVGVLPETNSTFVAGLGIGIDGSSADPGMPVWCDEPFSVGTLIGWNVLGWETKGQCIVLNWSGFQFK